MRFLEVAGILNKNEHYVCILLSTLLVHATKFFLGRHLLRMQTLKSTIGPPFRANGNTTRELKDDYCSEFIDLVLRFTSLDFQDIRDSIWHKICRDFGLRFDLYCPSNGGSPLSNLLRQINYLWSLYPSRTRISHKFSIGLRSGEFAGNGRT